MSLVCNISTYMYTKSTIIILSAKEAYSKNIGFYQLTQFCVGFFFGVSGKSKIAVKLWKIYVKMLSNLSDLCLYLDKIQILTLFR